MTTDFLYDFLSSHKLAVISSLSPDNFPQSALIGFAVASDLRIIFDTVTDSRKYHNLTANPSTSLVIGWKDEQTIQLEGKAYIPEGDELEELKKVYYRAYPDGWDRAATWPNLTYFCVKPTWLRYSNFNTDPPQIMEWRPGDR
ncbi:MAG: pyridoxamine 5'-phosphate oxidase family protein [Candidatus Kapaibacterium sp.]